VTEILNGGDVESVVNITVFRKQVTKINGAKFYRNRLRGLASVNFDHFVNVNTIGTNVRCDHKSVEVGSLV